MNVPHEAPDRSVASPNMDLVIATLEDRPDLGEMLWDLDGWPAFMEQDPIGHLYYSRADSRYAASAMVAIDRADPCRAVARSCSVPFAFGEEFGRPDLPPDGWDGVIRWAWLDDLARRTPTHASALEILIRPDLRGQGLSLRMLEAMRANVRRQGFSNLFAPVRPSGKNAEPHTPMAEYARRIRDDGLPHDPWLRVHARAGAEVIGVCPCAMTIRGTVAQWRSWTGLGFDTSGNVVVPEALLPVHCSLEHDHAVYVEPGVWVHHRLGEPNP